MSNALGHAWLRWQQRRAAGAARIELDGKRLFILPSRSGSGFALVLLLNLLAAINYQNSMVYALVFLLGSVFVVAILHTYRNLAGLVISAAPVTPVFAGEHARFTLRLESQGREHQAIGLGWSAGVAQYFDVAAAHVQALELSLPSAARGWLVAPPIRIQSGFPLGVLQVWSWLDTQQAALVYPQPLQGELPLRGVSRTDSAAASQRLAGPGVDDFQGLKVYQPGDSWRRMDWKAWSRGDGLLIKDFADHAAEELALDFLALGGDVEQRLSRLCYWVLELSRREQPFALDLPGQHLPAASGIAHRDACLRALALYGQHP